MTLPQRGFANIPVKEWQGLTWVWLNKRFTVRATCTSCAVTETLAFAQQVPPRIAIPKFTRRGWKVTGKNLCLVCSTTKKEPRMSPVKPVPSPQPILSTPAPTEAAKKVKRLVFQALEDYYDDVTKRYRPGRTDASIAGEIGCSEVFVKTVRESDFGPITEPVPAEFERLYRETERAFENVRALREDMAAICLKHGWVIS